MQTWRPTCCRCGRSPGQQCLHIILCKPQHCSIRQLTVTVQVCNSILSMSSIWSAVKLTDMLWCWLQVGLRAQDEPDCLPLAARHSPLPGTILQHSLHKVLAPTNNGSTTPDAVAGLAKALRAIADKLEGTPDMLTGAIHSFAMDFLINRLPPHPKQLPGRGNAPTISDRIWCRLAGWSYLLPFEVTGMNCEDDEVAGLEEGSVKIVSCLMNSREEHMITMPDEFEDESNSSSGSGEGTSEEAASTDKEEVQSGGSQQASGAAAVEPSASGAAAVEPSANEAAAGASSDEEGQGKQWQQDAQPLAAVSEGTKVGKAWCLYACVRADTSALPCNCSA
eukprot:GHRR01002898.1.p1 GENE.GHRR01002898.1~~GHRR01002898.1.p1  ORF type:complete len:336 (+),score=124.75 GHRR01002898.1:1704-2711(+)